MWVTGKKDKRGSQKNPWALFLGHFFKILCGNCVEISNS